MTTPQDIKNSIEAFVTGIVDKMCDEIDKVIEQNYIPLSEGKTITINLDDLVRCDLHDNFLTDAVTYNTLTSTKLVIAEELKEIYTDNSWLVEVGTAKVITTKDVPLSLPQWEVDLKRL